MLGPNEPPLSSVNLIDMFIWVIWLYVKVALLPEQKI